MSTQYRLVQSGKTASGGCSAGQGSSEPVAPRIYLLFYSVSIRKMSDIFNHWYLLLCLATFVPFYTRVSHFSNLASISKLLKRLATDKNVFTINYK
jgi:hypothetical protein